MRIKHRYLQYDSHLDTIGPVRKILDSYSLSYSFKEDRSEIIPTLKYIIEFYLYEDAPEFRHIKQALDPLIEPQEIATDYEENDFEAAEWFIASTGQFQYPQPEDGYLQKNFDLSEYCSLCGIGSVQNAPFRLKSEPKQKNNQFWGLHWEYSAVFVRQEAKNILEKESIKGIRFSKPVLNKSGLEIDGFFQMHIDNILDKGFDSYNTNRITCKIDNEEDRNTDLNLQCCQRVKFHHPRIGGYLFDSEIFNSELKIVQSHEYFGSGASAHRLQIFSKRVRDLILKTKLKGLAFTPISHNRFQ